MEVDLPVEDHHEGITELTETDGRAGGDDASSLPEHVVGDGPASSDHADHVCDHPVPDLHEPSVAGDSSKTQVVMNVDGVSSSSSPRCQSSPVQGDSNIHTSSLETHAVNSSTQDQHVRPPPPINNHDEAGKFYTVDLTHSTAHATSPLASSVTFRDRMRRWVQRALVASGRANPSADEYFEQQKDRFLGLLQHLQAVQSSLKRHASLLTQFVGSASQLGVDIRCVVQGSGENVFSTAMASQEAQMTDADATLSGALRILEGRIQHMKSFHECLSRRTNLKLDVDSFERRVDARKGVSGQWWSP
ncbi:hypothetical protein, variant [Aphanomyces astaci]|uniref:Uncharacterized protein n=1 Tax=Aphanomyces astaci TaxID=112090 RepID=W4FAN0_APHAT|nr:hypothetical protein, variant [Aphanomyces astaci]ETV63768.1 hypothetical protein, variant [Aphanomyces astaci]|eukprot:XP_009846747.1 hypothetical protein, variant [Aphanomyces astaci]